MHSPIYIFLFLIANINFSSNSNFYKAAKSEVLNRFSSNLIEKFKSNTVISNDTLLPRQMFMIYGVETNTRQRAKEDSLINQKNQEQNKIELNTLATDSVIDSSIKAQPKVKLFLEMKFEDIETNMPEPDSLVKIDSKIDTIEISQKNQPLKSDSIEAFLADSLKKTQSKIQLFLEMKFEKIEVEKESESVDDTDLVVEDTQFERDPIIVTEVKKEVEIEKPKKKKKKSTTKNEGKPKKTKEKDKTKKIKEKKPEKVKSEKHKKPKIGDIVDLELQEKAKFYLSRAKMEIDKENTKKAISYIDKSIDLNPSYTAAYNLKGDIYSSLTIYEKALLQYKKASFLEPKNAQINYNVGNCFIRLEKDDLAIKEWSIAIANDPNYILAYAGRASLLMKDKKYEEAIQDYDHIFRSNKYFYVAYKGRGVAYLELGNYNRAILDFNNYLSYEPKDDFVLYKRGMAKLSDSEIFGGCVDLLSATELGNKEAEKALKKYCEK